MTDWQIPFGTSDPSGRNPLPLAKTRNEKDELFSKLIREKCHSGDPEKDHREADHILTSALRNCNMLKTVKAYLEVTRHFED